MSKKLSTTFLKAAIASGAIVPPRGCTGSGGLLLAAVGWLITLMAAAALAVAYFVGRL